MAKPTRARNTAAKKATEPTVNPTTTQVVDDSVAQGAPEVQPATPAPVDMAAETQMTARGIANFQPDPSPAMQRAAKAMETTNQLKEQVEQVENASENPALDKILGKPTGLPTPSPDRPEVYNLVDRTLQPFVEGMMPTTNTTDQKAADLHYSMFTLIKHLLNVGGNEMKVGVPYLFSYYRKYKGSVFHPQNHHRGVGLMRGSEADIDFYRNLSRLLVDISHPDSAVLVLQRTDISRFRTLTLNIASPAAQRMSENLITLISRVHAK